MEQEIYDIQIGIDYPAPIIDLESAAKQAREKLWSFRSHPVARAEKSRILAKHVRPRKTKQNSSKRNQKKSDQGNDRQASLF